MQRLLTRLSMVVILTAVLGLAAVPVAADGDVIQFTAHVTEYTLLEVVSMTELPGGRILVVEKLRMCYQAVDLDPAQDFITGCHYFNLERIIDPSGTHHLSFTSTEQVLTNLVGVGGWYMEGQGVWTPGTKIITVPTKMTGWGVLEGWTAQTHQFIMNEGEREFLRGHFTPPR